METKKTARIAYTSHSLSLKFTTPLAELCGTIIKVISLAILPLFYQKTAKSQSKS
jgi:hypothetical protein